jgi:hypothetical protein
LKTRSASFVPQNLAQPLCRNELVQFNQRGCPRA